MCISESEYVFFAKQVYIKEIAPSIMFAIYRGMCKIYSVEDEEWITCAPM